MSSIRRAYTSFVEQGCFKIGAIAPHSDLDLIIARATSSDDLPLPDRYIYDIALIFSSTPCTTRAFAISFTRRFGQTKSWRVALKCLLLLHGLLQMLPRDHHFRADILSARANALVSFYPCNFRGSSSSSCKESYTAFVHSYAHLIDEVISCCHVSISDPDGSGTITPPPLSYSERMEAAGRALERVQELQSLVDRAMECVPAGPTSRSSVVRAAMRQVGRESHVSYVAARKGLTVVLDSILQMPYRNCVEGLATYKRAADQAAELGEFYGTCKSRGFCGEFEWPVVDKIPMIQVRMLERFVEQMWHLTDSSSESSPITMKSDGEEGGDGDQKQIVVHYESEWEKFEDEVKDGGKEEFSLVKFEDDDDEERSWEVLLETSISRGWSNKGSEGEGEEDEERSLRRERDERSLQLFSPHLFNPFFWS